MKLSVKALVHFKGCVIEVLGAWRFLFREGLRRLTGCDALTVAMRFQAGFVRLQRRNNDRMSRADPTDQLNID